MCLFGLGVWEGWLAPEMNHRPSGAEQEMNEKKGKMREYSGARSVMAMLMALAGREELFCYLLPPSITQSRAKPVRDSRSATGPISSQFSQLSR